MDPSSAAITAAAWAWDKYGEAVTGKTAGALKGRWDKFRWKDAAEKYRAKIKKLYGTMQIMGMAKPAPLDDIFTDAYMLDRPTAFGRFDIEQLKRLSADPEKPPEKAERINGLRLVREKGNLFILGKPGAGKTTFLKYIALQAAEENVPKIPVFVSLKEWADSGSDLMTFIAEQFDKCAFPDARPFIEELLESGQAIVLFDSLDEVNQEGGQRDRQTRAMNNFVEKYDRTQCLITCRLAASDYSFQPFTYVEIADFTEPQIEKFVGNWFRDHEGEKDEETCQKFLTEFRKDDNRGLRDLARTPLLLTLLCLAFNETLTFPQRRVEIYEEALEALLKRWDASRRIKRDEVYRKLSLGHKTNMLARIAAETFENNEYFIPQGELAKRIAEHVKNVPPHDAGEEADGEAVLKAVEAQHGIFVERAHKIYSFSHLTFQEYFTAKYIVANAAQGTLKELVRAHCTDARWREVFLLTTSLLPDAGQFMVSFRRHVDTLLERDEKLRALLTWADKRASSVEVAPWLARPAYLDLELFWQSIDFALSLALDNAYSDYNDFLTLSPDLALDYALSLALRFGGTPALDDANARALESGLLGLARDLALLSLLSEDDGDEVRRKVERGLSGLMIKHRDIGHEWNLTGEQEVRLADYLNATRLLRDCLELAYMPPEEKESVLNSLYLPPARGDEGAEG